MEVSPEGKVLALRIALCQMDLAKGDVAENRRRSVAWIERAVKAQAELVLLPELATTGYTLGERFQELAEEIPGETSRLWSELAARHGIHIIGGIPRIAPSGLIYNSALFVGPEGIVGVYDKAVTPLYLHGNDLGDGVCEEAEIFRRGDAMPVFSTPIGRIGILICQDAVYGEFVRAQALQGADLCVQISNSPRIKTKHEDDITPLTTRVHAFDTGTAIAFCNRAGEESYTFRGEQAVSRFGVKSHVCDADGNFLALAEEGGKEELILAEVDLSASRHARWRQKFHRDWRPDLLRPLVRIP